MTTHGNRNRSVRLAVVAAALLAVSACAGIPSSGPVTKVADDSGLGESTVRYSPAGPAEGASPQEIVRGYLDAMLAYPASSGTATAFLTPAAARRWSPTASVRVYSSIGIFGPTLTGGETGDDGEPTDKTRNPVEMETRMVEDARLDQQGHYTREARATDITYRLERIDDEWRIANPQTGSLVTRKFFDDYFRPFNIYAFDRPGRRLVPDPIHVLVGDQLATNLVTSLARGPAGSAGGALRTYLPALSALRPSIPVSDGGVADVEFSTDLAGLGGAAQDRLSAQIVWTLRQVPGVRAVRLAGSTGVIADDDAGVQDIGSWGGFGPSIARGRAYAISAGRVVQVDDATVKPISGAWGKDARGAVAIGVGESGVAGVLPGRTLVRVTNRRGTDARTFAGSGFLTPQWDGDGTVWLLDRTGGTRVRIVRGDGIRTLPTGRLGRLDVTSFALSPDGARYAVTVAGSGSPVRVGWVRRDAKNRVVGLGSPVTVAGTPGSLRSMSWSSTTEVSYLAASRSGRQVYSTAIDGSMTTGGLARGGALLPDVGAATLALGRGQTPNRYVSDSRGRLWLLVPGESWRLIPGTKVTALTYGL